MMKAQSEHPVWRGKCGIRYLRKRIPLYLRDAHPPGVAVVLESLRTTAEALARLRLFAELVALDQQFERVRAKAEGQWNSPGEHQVQRATHPSDQRVHDLA